MALFSLQLLLCANVVFIHFNNTNDGMHALTVPSTLQLCVFVLKITTRHFHLAHRIQSLSPILWINAVFDSLTDCYVIFISFLEFHEYFNRFLSQYYAVLQSHTLVLVGWFYYFMQICSQFYQSSSISHSEIFRLIKW